MKTLRMTLLSFAALVFFLIPADAFAGPAKFRVRVRTRRPEVRVIRVQNRHHLTRHDRKIARRLARYTGYSRHRFLEYRARGYSWLEIGRWLDLPRRMILAARYSDTWRRYQRPIMKCGTHDY